MKAIVSKQSIRELVKQNRLPSRLEMFLTGAWLHDILTANKLDIKLWHMAYRATAKSLDSKRMTLTWRQVDA